MLIWLGAMLLLGNLLALPLLFVPRVWREPLMQYAISRLCRLFLAGAERCGLMRIDLSALDSLGRQGPLLLVPNHPSMIDAFLVLSRLPRLTCLMKASIGCNLFLGIGARLAGYVSNRHPADMFRTAIACVRSGKQLLIFPEGTRTSRWPINPLQGAAVLVARKSGAPLQTILISTNSPYLSKGWKIWQPPQFPLVYRAEPGRRFATGEQPDDTTAALQNYFETVLPQPIDPRLATGKNS